MSGLPHHRTPRDASGDMIPAFRLLAEHPIWLPWRSVDRGNGKIGKPPVVPATGRGNGWQEPTAAVPYDVAVSYAQAHGLAGIGVVMGPLTRQLGLVGLDLDGAIDADKKTTPWASDILRASGALESYVERSPSGRGFRMLALAQGEGIGADVELYDGTSARFLTVTGDRKSGWPDTIAAAEATIAAALERVEAKPKRSHQGEATAPVASGAMPQAVVPPLADFTREALRGALAAVPVAEMSYGEWIKIGQAIAHQTGGDADGAEIWHDWSALDDGRYDLDDCDAKWRSFGKPRKGAPVTARHIIKLAQARGWAQPQSDPTSALGATDDAEAIGNPFAAPSMAKPATWPEGALPTPIETHARQVAAYLGCDGDAAALLFLGALANAVPARVRYDVHGNGRFTTGCNLYVGVVGAPGMSKSPLINAALAPIHAADLRWAKTHAAAAKRVKRSAAKGNTVDDGPTRRRKAINNATLEATVAVLAVNPDGLLVAPDELAGWLGGIDRYMSGSKGGSSEGAFWLIAADAGPYSYDRVTGGRALYIPHAHVGIIGGIQPAVLAMTLGRMSGDGLLQRFIFAELPRRLEPDRAPINDHARDVYEGAIALLLDLATTRGEVQLSASEEAAKVNFDAEAWSRARVNDGRLSAPLRGFYAKMPGLHAKLCLALALAEWAAAEHIADPGGLNTVCEGVQLEPIVSGAIARRAWAIVVNFIVPTARNVYRMLGEAGEEHDDVLRLARGILALPDEERPKLTHWRAGRIHRRFRGKPGWPMLDAAASELETIGWLKRDETTPGRTVWKISPAIFEGRFSGEASAAIDDEVEA